MNSTKNITKFPPVIYKSAMFLESPLAPDITTF